MNLLVVSGHLNGGPWESSVAGSAPHEDVERKLYKAGNWADLEYIQQHYSRRLQAEVRLYCATASGCESSAVKPRSSPVAIMSYRLGNDRVGISALDDIKNCFFILLVVAWAANRESRQVGDLRDLPPGLRDPARALTNPTELDG